MENERKQWDRLRDLNEMASAIPAAILDLEGGRRLGTLAMPATFNGDQCSAFFAVLNILASLAGGR